MPGTADEQFLALRTICVRTFAVDVSFIDVAQAHVERDLACMIKSLGWSSWLVLQLEVRVKRSEMQRHIRPQMSQNPFGKLSRLCRIVIQGWNHQVGDLEPDRRLLHQPRQRLQHRLKMRQGNLPIEILGEGLEVDVRRVDVIVNVVERVVCDVTIGDHHRFQAIFPGLFADVDNVFAPDGRLVVGERDGTCCERT